MSSAEEFPSRVPFAFRERKAPNLELTLAMRAAKTGSVEKKAVGTHLFHQIHSLVAEVADIARRSRGGGGNEPFFGVGLL